MKTSPREILMGFAIFIIGTDFFTAMALYGKYTSVFTFPNITSAFNYGAAWATAQSDLGGGWNFLGYSLGFIENFFVGILSGFVFLFNIFNFIYQAAVWAINLVNFPFTLIPFPYGVLFDLIFNAILVISFLFSIRVAYSGLVND